MYYEKDYAFTHQTYYIVTSDHSATVNKNGATVNVEISLFEGYSNLPIPDISITMNLTSTNNNWLNSLTYSSDPILTNTDGKGVFNIKFPDRGDKSYSAATVNIKFMIQYKGITKEKTVSIEQGGNSPFIYSEDQHGDLHFEHEPISLKLIKAVEGSSYGTLRLLQDQEGVYYIQVIEEGSSTTVLNNAVLYAVDYIDDGTVLDLFFDIAGNPHTIREQLRPVSFVDQYGNSYIDQILEKDGIVAKVSEENDSTLSYFTATFDRPNNNQHAKFMFSVQDSGNSQEVLDYLLNSFNAQQNLWWLDQALSNDPLNRTIMQKYL